jgi:adenylate cyclase
MRSGGRPEGDEGRDLGERDALARLSVGDRQKRLRRFWRSIPGPPRCKLCHRPFAGIGGPIMRLAGLGRWPGNPKYCRGCFRALYRQRAGAEIECSLVFADVRDSTPLAESLRPAEFRRRMDRFYAAAFDALVARDAFVDKFVGDEVIGIFVPALTDGPHARQALGAAVDVLRATGHADGQPWLPVGVGVNTGVAYVGAVGTDEHVEFTALGDPVNVAARLASEARTGEVLATVETVRSAAWPDGDLEHRRVELKGKAEPTEVVVLHAASAPPSTPNGPV